jgi:rod shape determining protein RodA
VRQSKIAIGSGGVFGKGLLKGTQTRYGFVPEQRTDFIFDTIAEGFGFTGSFILMIIYLLLLFRIVTVAERQRSVFSRCYGYGVAAVFFFHIAINVAMAIGLAPVIGIPLPFISYGGTSLLTFTILLFILVRLDADRHMVIR